MEKLQVIIFLIGSFMFSGYGQTIDVFKQVKDDTVYVDFINPFFAPMEINLAVLDSASSYTHVNSYGILKYRDTLKNAVIIPVDKLKDTASIPIKNYINFKATFGDPKNKIDVDYKYSLPFPKGKRYKIIQSFGGKFSHNKPSSRYAIDIGTKIGDTITAIRPGIVFFVKEDSNEFCKTRKCVDKGNKVLVLHDDGTMAHYVHLDFDGALVEVGDRVEDSEVIGISGMTGFTTTPHLHLVLYKSGSISIPFKFKRQKGKKLKQGKYYRRKD